MNRPLIIALLALTSCYTDEVGTEMVAAGDVDPLFVAESEFTLTDHFATGEVCAQCHSNHNNASAMRDAAGNELAPYNLWRGTMMANSARDPLWRAYVSAEILSTPRASNDIEAECMRCHTPIANVESQRINEDLELELLEDEGDLGHLVRNGVNCTVCHQITETGLGTEESWNGNYEINSDQIIYGPHQDVATGPMQAHTGYTPTYSDHTRTSELCATCHTLFTDPVNPDGEEAQGHFAEQTPYLEWQASSYSPDLICQDCHMPLVDDLGEEIETAIARSPPGGDFNIPERTPYGQHRFVGGNTLMPQILRDWTDVLNPDAQAKHFDETIEYGKVQLANDTGTVEVRNAALSGKKLTADIDIRIQTGHKFPTGIPLRRAWLRIRALEASGEVRFVSGGFDSAGRIVDGRGMLADFEEPGGPIAPHREQVSNDRHVALYEAVMADENGRPTFRLVRAANFYKDNRMLPVGWTSPDERILPVGVDGDEDFVPGGDTVGLSVRLPKVDGPITLEVTLFFQPLSARVMHELFRWDTEEVAAFRTMWESADRDPEVISTTTVVVQ